MTKYISIFTLLMMLIFPVHSTGNSSVLFVNRNNKLTDKQWVEDINYVEKNLAEKHLNIYHSISKQEYEKEFNDLKKDVSTLSDSEIELRLSQIFASIGDEHTKIYIYQYIDNKIYPVNASWFGNDLKVTAIDKTYKEIIGDKLIAINDIPIEKVMSRINTLIPHDNDQWLKYNTTEYIYVLDVLKFFNITAKDTAKFTFADNNGKTINIDFTPTTSTTDNIVYVKDSIINKPITELHDDSSFYNSLYWYKYVPEGKIMYFQYNQCIDKSVAKALGYEDYNKYPDFNEFTDKLLNELNEKDVDKLVIDLRNNTGGNPSLIDHFAVNLRTIDKFNTKGKVYVLIGKGTFSAGVSACASLKESVNPIFIGEPTGGNVNGYGGIVGLTLPNSKIPFQFPTQYVEFYPEYKENFSPDILVEQSFDDYVKGVDDAYEAAKNNEIK